MADPMISEIIKARPLLVLGMGNPLRGDDAIGHLLAEALASLNRPGFRAYAVATSIENAMRWVRETAGGTVLLVDAVFDEALPEGSWALYPADQLDSMCHATHTIPLSLLLSYWQREVPGIAIHFLGVSIRTNDEMAPLSPALQQTLAALKTMFTEE